MIGFSRLRLSACLALSILLPGLPALGGDQPAAPRIVIASINTHGELDHGKILKDLARERRLARPDVLLLQEVDGPPQERRMMVQALANALGMPHLYVPDLPGGSNGDGLVTLSRFRLKDTRVVPLKHFDLVFRSRRRIALAQTAETPLGEILLFNLHLDTRINAEDRLEQLSAVLDLSRPETRPVVIGGDFNTGDFRWVHHLIPVPNRGGQTGAVVDRMAVSGFETPFRDSGPTFDSLGLHLDWLFLRGLKCFGAGVREIDFSDHHAIWTEVGLP